MHIPFIHEVHLPCDLSKQRKSHSRIHISTRMQHPLCQGSVNYFSTGKGFLHEFEPELIDVFDVQHNRDVAINLRVHTPESQKLCVDSHVCEVLLLLKSFAQLKHDEGHNRYVNITFLLPANVEYPRDCTGCL
jgi:hypothetical protein